MGYPRVYQLTDWPAYSSQLGRSMVQHIQLPFRIPNVKPSRPFLRLLLIRVPHVDKKVGCRHPRKLGTPVSPAPCARHPLTPTMTSIILSSSSDGFAVKINCTIRSAACQASVCICVFRHAGGVMLYITTCEHSANDHAMNMYKNSRRSSVTSSPLGRRPADIGIGLNVRTNSSRQSCRFTHWLENSLSGPCWAVLPTVPSRAARCRRSAALIRATRGESCCAEISRG